MTILSAFLLLLLLPSARALGGASTLAIAHATETVCGVLAAAEPRSVLCFNGTRTFPLYPNITVDTLSGGSEYLCGTLSAGNASALFCWTPAAAAKRLYYGNDSLDGVSVGEDHVAAAFGRGRTIGFWRTPARFPDNATDARLYRSLTSGRGFSCAIESSTGSVKCWGADGGIERAFANHSMASLYAGEGHACGIDAGGVAICRGRNESGQLGAGPFAAYEYTSLALGSAHTCAIRRGSKTVACWGGGGGGVYSPLGDNYSFELIVAGGNKTCGVASSNFSVICWRNLRSSPDPSTLPLPQILPGFCKDGDSDSVCSCGVFPDSSRLCSGSGFICMPCNPLYPNSPPPRPGPASPPAAENCTDRRLLAFAIVGTVGLLAGICSVLYCLWHRFCRRKQVYNSVQPTRGGVGALPALSVFSSPSKSARSRSRSALFQRQGSRTMRRQRSGPSSSRQERAEEFTLAELSDATTQFSLENKIGAGSFGTVYHGKLPDGREVAIKRSETGPRTNRFQEKENAFRSELAFLSRLHHKHLVGLVGFCEESEERLLVYEFMKNGALYDHLHSGRGDGVLSSWRMRIKVLLDAARGIEYLHSYAVPPIIHRDIKSSNILLDADLVARVSDFGLSLSSGGVGENDGADLRAAGTVGYMDPEYYGLRHLTVKSDVYGLGVVMLEVLTGRRAVFREGEGEPTSVVDYAVGRIARGEVAAVLDGRMPRPGPGEAEAVERVAHTAVQCVRMEGRERPTMTDVVANLECALLLCDENNGSISSASGASD